MTNAQLKDLLRWAIRRISRDNASLVEVHTNPRTGRIEPASARLEAAKTVMWLSKARAAVARPRGKQ